MTKLCFVIFGTIAPFKIRPRRHVRFIVHRLRPEEYPDYWSVALVPIFVGFREELKSMDRYMGLHAAAC